MTGMKSDDQEVRDKAMKEADIFVARQEVKKKKKYTPNDNTGI